MQGTETSSGIYQGDVRELVWEPWDDRTQDPYIYCPKHTDTHRPSMRVYATGAKCFTCGAWIGRAEFSKLFDGDAHTASKVLARPVVRKPARLVDPLPLALAAHKLLITNQQKLDWLYRRGITSAVINGCLLGHNGPAYTLPLTGNRGEIASIRFRRDDTESPDSPKYWGLAGMNGIQWYGHFPEPGEQTLVMTEGEFDALLLIGQSYLPAFSLTNGSRAHEKLGWAVDLETIQTLILCRDQDVAGRTATDDLCNRLAVRWPHLRLVNITWQAPYKDITEVWQHRPDLYQEIVSRIQAVLGGRA